MASTYEFGNKINMFLIQYFIFLILNLFETNGIKLIKLRIIIDFIISSSDLS